MGVMGASGMIPVPGTSLYKFTKLAVAGKLVSGSHWSSCSIHATSVGYKETLV